MQKMLFMAAAVALGAAPAIAQGTTGTANVAQTEQVEKQKTVTKVVCKRIEETQTTGSRLGSAQKVCKKVDVPVTEADTGQAPHGTRGDAR